MKQCGGLGTVPVPQSATHLFAVRLRPQTPTLCCGHHGVTCPANRTALKHITYNSLASMSKRSYIHHIQGAQLSAGTKHGVYSLPWFLLLGRPGPQSLWGAPERAPCPPVLHPPQSPAQCRPLSPRGRWWWAGQRLQDCTSAARTHTHNKQTHNKQITNVLDRSVLHGGVRLGSHLGKAVTEAGVVLPKALSSLYKVCQPET